MLCLLRCITLTNNNNIIFNNENNNNNDNIVITVAPVEAIDGVADGPTGGRVVWGVRQKCEKKTTLRVQGRYE